MVPEVDPAVARSVLQRRPTPRGAAGVPVRSLLAPIAFRGSGRFLGCTRVLTTIVCTYFTYSQDRDQLAKRHAAPEKQYFSLPKNFS